VPRFSAKAQRGGSTAPNRGTPPARGSLVPQHKNEILAGRVSRRRVRGIDVEHFVVVDNRQVRLGKRVIVLG